MAIRTVNGNTFTEDGWPLVDQAGCTWIAIPGTNPIVHIQVQSGLPAQVFTMWEGDWNAYLEPLEDPTTGSWTESNSVLGQPGKNNGSNHLGGTAVDSNWERHPMGPEAPGPASGFTQAQYDEMQRMKDFYTFTAKDGTVIQVVWWANDWNTPHDSMHSQMGYDTYAYRDEVQAWVNAHVRPDGLSTYRRGVQPQPTAAAQILAQAIGVSLDFATSILPQVWQGLVMSSCRTPNAIAMWLAQMGEESAGFTATVEIGDIDGTTYQGRTWVQITGVANYRAFSQWCYDQGLISSPTLFVDQPALLGAQQWAAVGPAWYWTVARPNIPAMADAGDVVGVTKAINGGDHGLDDRQRRYSLAIALGDQLLTLLSDTTGDDDMAQVPQDQWDRVYHEASDLRASRSPLRHLGEGTIDTWSGFTLNVDGSVHVLVCVLLAGYGHPPTLALLNEVASADPVKYPDRQDDAKIAQAILAGLAAGANPVQTNPVLAAAAPVATPAVAAAPPGITYTQLPTPTYTAAGATPGQLIGQAYDALKALPTDLNDQDKASLTSLMSVLARLAGTDTKDSK